MVYVIGIVGFLLGFGLGMYIISLKLKDKSKEELLQDKALWWAYGTLNWIIALVCCWAAIYLYNINFSS